MCLKHEAARVSGSTLFSSYHHAGIPPPPVLMHHYSYPYPQTAAPVAPHRAQRGPLPPAIKPYIPGGGHSTSPVWGPANDSDSDCDTIAAHTSTSIASSQSRAPGNKPSQQRRVQHWVHTTTHHAPEFRSPFAPAKSKTHSHHGSKAKKEPLPVWTHQRPPQPPLRHAMSQPVMVQQPPQYAQPQMVWMPASAPTAPAP
ncbi:hypothetical protein B0H17DRAFT_404268 [Mycena rosella]|uniref:Uncharacterized protein n=1 Tax=Mycena rosella TaxID=1033263 RepID=A0AAD7CLY7_MYCRO|nr:hypothetical protein B0H17DRAFT_404268 [Mycena rosella]